MSDEEGIKQEGTGNVFDFAVETKSSSDMKLGYKLNIEKLEPETGYEKLEDSQVKIYLTDTNDNKIIGPLKISQLENYNLYEDVNIHSKENNVQVDKYRIRVWIDSEVDASSWDENTKLEYKFKIGVGASENQGKYTVTYNANGGEGKMAPSVYEGSTEEVLRKNTYTRGGYTFKGWSTTKDGEVEYQDQNTATTLTQDENNKNQTLYAVWNPNTYTVKYHPNGGLIKTTQTLEPDVNYDPMDFGDNNTKWTKEGNVYKSGSLSVQKPTFLFHSITLEESGTLSFEVAVSQSEDYNGFVYLLGSSDFSSTIKQESISATPGITKEEDLVYQKIEISLEAGSYVLAFGISDFSKTSEGLDRAYIKNIQVSNYTEGQVENSTYTVGQNNKLKKNEYGKEHYTFKGWNTNKNETNVKYQDENDLTKLESKVKENDQIDLHAIWEIDKFTVNVVVQNGTINGDSTKQIEYNKNGVFTLISNIDSKSGRVTCTNGQSGILEDGVLTIENVSGDTTCTANFIDSVTTLYEDGTLIINENGKNIKQNQSMHGNIAKEYDAMSESNSYVMSSNNDQPWYNERSSIKSVEIGQKIKPVSTSYWFQDLFRMEKGDFTNLDTSSVTDMSNMFESAGYYSTTFNLNLSGWKALKADMSHMFSNAGNNATIFELKGLENWDVSKVTNMNSMFNGVGQSSVTWTIGDISNWDVSNVTNMGYMFSYAGKSATTWSIGNLSNWDVSNVTNMGHMFSYAGKSATTWSIGNLSNWDTSNVTDMSSMFSAAGYSATTWSIGNLSNWDVSNVTNMGYMFSYAGYSATIFELKGLENWNTSSVIFMYYMFNYAGYSATTFTLDLSNWNVSNVTNMNGMFYKAGLDATTWSVKIPSKTGDLTNTTSKWYGSSESVYASPASGKSFTLS